MRRCFGVTRNLNLCGRIGDWRFFCSEHRRQPLVWLFGIVFTVLAGIASIQSAWWSSQVDYNVIPVVDLSIGQPFASSTIITLKNSGTVPIVDVAANIRCLLLEKDKKHRPTLFFTGFPSIGNTTSWWTIDKIEPGDVRTKDANEPLELCLRNMENFAQSQATFRQSLEQSQAPFIIDDTILAVDVVYRREIDRKEYEMSGIARLMKEGNTGKAVLRPLPMSDSYRDLLGTVTAPNYRVRSK